MLKRVGHAAQAADHSRAYIIREAIKYHLDDIETAYAADKIYEDVLSGKEKTISFDEVRRENGL